MQGLRLFRATCGGFGGFEVADGELDGGLAGLAGVEVDEFVFAVEGVAGGAPGFETAVVFAFDRPKHEGGIDIGIAHREFHVMPMVGHAGGGALHREECHVHFVGIHVKTTGKTTHGLGDVVLFLGGGDVEAELGFVLHVEVGMETRGEGHHVIGVIDEELIDFEGIAFEEIGELEFKVKGVLGAGLFGAAEGEDETCTVGGDAIAHFPGQIAGKAVLLEVVGFTFVDVEIVG